MVGCRAGLRNAHCYILFYCLQKARVLASGVHLARELVNSPANYCNTVTLAQAARDVAQKVCLDLLRCFRCSVDCHLGQKNSLRSLFALIVCIGESEVRNFGAARSRGFGDG